MQDTRRRGRNFSQTRYTTERKVFRAAKQNYTRTAFHFLINFLPYCGRLTLNYSDADQLYERNGF